MFSFVKDSFERERQIKAGSRKKKIQLIESINPGWRDISEILREHRSEELIRIKQFLK
jgi:putative endonuclease